MLFTYEERKYFEEVEGNDGPTMYKFVDNGKAEKKDIEDAIEIAEEYIEIYGENRVVNIDELRERLKNDF